MTRAAKHFHWSLLGVQTTLFKGDLCVSIDELTPFDLLPVLLLEIHSFNIYNIHIP